MVWLLTQFHKKNNNKNITNIFIGNSTHISPHTPAFSVSWCKKKPFSIFPQQVFVLILFILFAFLMCWLVLIVLMVLAEKVVSFKKKKERLCYFSLSVMVEERQREKNTKPKTKGIGKNLCVRWHDRSTTGSNDIVTIYPNLPPLHTHITTTITITCTPQPPPLPPAVPIFSSLPTSVNFVYIINGYKTLHFCNARFTFVNNFKTEF